jgi:hypothetical protein
LSEAKGTTKTKTFFPDMEGVINLKGKLRGSDKFGRLSLELESGGFPRVTAVKSVGWGADAVEIATLTPPPRHAELYRRQGAELKNKAVIAKVRIRHYIHKGRRGTALDLVDLAQTGAPGGGSGEGAPN